MDDARARAGERIRGVSAALTKAVAHARERLKDAAGGLRKARSRATERPEQVPAALRAARAHAALRVRASAWSLTQQALAATVAWVLATHVIDHRQPFFAPMAAVVALNAPLGQRGGNALRLLEGVVIGIIAGEIGLATLGPTSGALFLATLASLTTARALGGSPLALAQAATAAILTIATGDTSVGPERLIDALIGGGVALVFSQILFAPEPVRMLRRSESAALNDIANAFELTARALRENDRGLAGEAIETLRDLRDRLAELGRTRDASRHVATRSPAWRSQRDPVVQENENAGQLDLLGGSALMAVRNVTEVEGSSRGILAPTLCTLATEARALARDPGNHAVRQRAADGVLRCIRRLQSDERVAHAPAGSPLAATLDSIRSVAADIMIFAGVDADQAEDAIRRHDADIDVPEPAPTARVPFNGAWQRKGVQK